LKGKNRIGSFLIIILLGAATTFGALQVSPPEPLGQDVDKKIFSSERALSHLQVIGENPRVPGETFHEDTQSYIINFLKEKGVETEVQDVISISPDLRQVPFSSGKVKNIIGFLPGQDPQGNILLMAHYDSVPTGPGVGDDGIAVAAMLETVRALKERERLRNNIYFLFTDGHEYGLLGARAFLEQHPVASEIDLVFNFEGQGPNGPVFMFETSNSGRELIQGLSKGVSRPLGSSLSEDVYELLNFDNDFRLFADRGYSGLGMAIVSDMAYYHSAKDNLERLDPATLQHQGEFILGLAEFFGNHNMQNLEEEKLVFFNLTGDYLVSYSQFWAIPLSILGVLLTIIIWVVRKPKFSGLLAGVLVTTLSLGISIGLVFFLKELAGFNVDTYRSTYLQVGIAGFALALTLGLFYFACKNFSLRDMGWGVLTLWAVLAVISSVFLPGGSYVFIWPLFLALIYHLIPEKVNSFFPVALLTAMGKLFFLTPLIITLYRSLTMELPEVATGLMVLLVCLIIPVFKNVFSSFGWWLPGTAAILALIFLLSGFAPYDNQHPLRNTLIYNVDLDQETAEWVTLGESLDTWLENYLGQNPEERNIEALSPFFPRNYLAQNAPLIDLAGPGVELMEESFIGENRLLRFRVFSPGGAPVVSLYLDHGTEIISSQIGGRILTREFSSEWYWGVRFFGVPGEGFELELVVPATQEVNFLVVEQFFGLEKTQEIGWEPRPEKMIADPNFYLLTDSILISKTISF